MESNAFPGEAAFGFETVSFGLTHPSIFATSGNGIPARHRYLIVFRHRHLNFRLAEAQAIAEMAYGKPLAEDGLPVVVWELPRGGYLASPFWYAHLPTEAVARAMAERSMLIRCVVHLWGEGETWEAVQDCVRSYSSPERQTYTAEDQSFRFVIDAWGAAFTQEEKVKLIESFEPCTGFKGKIKLKGAQHCWWMIAVDTPHAGTMPPLPQWRFFGREVAVGAARAKLAVYELRKRRYLGPTSMDAELAFVMCALGGVQPSSVVVDPFVGTGSLLVSAADLGAHTIGIDIDIRVIKFGKKDNCGCVVNPWTNFSDYGLPAPLGLLRADLHRLPFRPDMEEIIDAIIADPPYGVRAGARKSHAAPDLHIEDRSKHIPSTAPYTLGECLRDLVCFAARLLVLGGKLVYWIPAAPGFYFDDELPTHPALEIVANCEQVLSSRYSRRLLVLRKTMRYDATAEQHHFEKLGPPCMAQDELRDHVYSSINDPVPRLPKFRNKVT